MAEIQIRNKEIYYIGLNTSQHDSSIALVNNLGQIIFAQSTERETQNKRALFSVPDNYSFVDTLTASYNFQDYEIATNWKSGHTLFNKFLFSLISYDSTKKNSFFNHLSKLVSGISNQPLIHLFNFNYVSNFSLRNFSGHTFRLLLSFKKNLPLKKITHFNHHLCHAYHAYYTSPFTSATLLIIDGNGDKGATYSIYKVVNNTINNVYQNNSSVSLGNFYWILTHLCKMNAFKGEEWKVMGMAPYGKLNDKVYKDFTEFLYLDGIELKQNKKNWKHFLDNKFDGQDYHDIPLEDIAFTGQLFFEELLTNLVTKIFNLFPHENLIISGGCALNSSAIGKLHIHTPYKHIFVPFAPADDGCAVGAALLNFEKHNKEIPIPHYQKSPFLGYEIKDSELELFMKYSGYKNQTIPYDDLYSMIADEIYHGKIIAWVQGKAEFGPRSLGNRSILANPCLPEMKDKINAHVKFREEYRPFAPSIIEEYAHEYFDDYYQTPYMERVLKIQKNKISIIPAVTHVDETGRLQTVSKDTNDHFYNLIHAFYKISGVPVLLNTSLNVMGKPIVSSVSDIASVFATSGLDILVINNTIFKKI